jgi:hypothetical protein
MGDKKASYATAPTNSYPLVSPTRSKHTATPSQTRHPTPAGIISLAAIYSYGHFEGITNISNVTPDGTV